MPNVLSGRFRTGSPRPLRTFAPGQCIPASAIMQFRRNVYEYLTKNSAHHFRMQSEREQTLVKLYQFIDLKQVVNECIRGNEHPTRFFGELFMIKLLEQ